MRILIATILFFLLFIPTHSEAQQKHSLLWRVSGNGLNQPSYLFGTIHVNDGEVFQFADSVILSLESCDAFAMEVHPDTALRGLMIKTLAGRFGNAEDAEDNRLREILSDEEYDRFSEEFKESTGLELSEMNQNNPWLIATMMEKRKRKPGKTDKKTFVDGHLYGLARTFRKPIYGLEELQDQLDMINGMSDQQVRKQLIGLMDSSSNSREHLRDSVIQLYRDGNLREIEMLANKELGQDGAMLYRNQVMVASIDSLIQTQTLFAAMGVAHLPGDQGVVQLLRNKGYRVEAVVSSYTGVADRFEIDPNQMEWSKISNEQYGFKLETPGPIFSIGSIHNLPTYIYPDISTGMFYMINLIDLREKVNGSNFDEEEYIDRLMKGMGNKESEVIRKKRVQMNGFDAAEVVMKTKGDQYIKNRFLIRNNVVYILSVGPEKDQLEGPFVDHFFDSFSSFKSPTYLSSDWEMYTEEKAAYSVQWPKEPETKVNVTPNPMDTESDDYVVYLKYSMDLANGCNYLLRYNDNPSGYYIPDPEVMLEELVKEFQTNGTLMGTPDTIQIDGYPGRSFNMMLMDKYYTRARIYVRGNRTYALLAQNLTEGAHDFTRDDFFDSFTLEPYSTPKFKKRHRPQEEPFEIRLFSKPLVQEEEGESFLVTMTNVYCTNPMSGGMYQFEYGELHDYFRITNIDTFYNRFAQDYCGFGDTIVRIDSVNMAGAEGIDVVTGNRYTDKQSRFRFWLDNKRYFFIYAEVSKDELFSDAHHKFFEESYVKTKTPDTFNIFGSKIDDLYAGLRTSDTIIYNYSLEALSFYQYSEDEFPKIYEMLNHSFPDDTSDEGVKSFLISGLSEIANEEMVDFLAELYQKDETSNAVRTNILGLLDELEDNLGFETSYKLLTNPPYLEELNWWVGLPLRDSIPFCKEHWSEILSLVGNTEYRSLITDLAQHMVAEDSGSHELIRASQDSLFAYVNEDLEAYNQKNRKDNYFYISQLYDYLEIQLKLTGLKSTDQFTQSLIEMSKGDNWINTLAQQTRIRNGLEVSPKLIKKKFKDLYSRFEMMTECYRSERMDLIPEKYNNQQEFARVSLINYVGYEDPFPDKTEFLDTLQANDSIYFVFTYNYSKTKYIDGEYIGIAGPFAPGKTYYNFDDYPAYTDWDYIESDWREHARRLIGEMEEYGY